MPLARFRDAKMSSNAFGYDSRLPENIREVFMWLCQDVASLQNKWSFYLGLFSNRENTALLSDLARGSFQIVEESLRNDMTMAICRLSDPPRSMRKENLSLAAVVQQCDDIESVPELLKDFLGACEPVRLHRNKRVGHNDLNTAIKPQDNPLPGIGQSRIDRILELARVILNTIYQRYVDGELYFVPLQIGGTDDLIYWLKMAKEHQAEKIIAFRKSAG